jgi:hypothetical protein
MDNTTFLASLKRALEGWVLTLIDKWVRNPQGLNPWHRHGTIASVVGGVATVRFDGEDTASTRLYPTNAAYLPVVGDRVYLVRSGNTWLIAFKVISS